MLEKTMQNGGKTTKNDANMDSKLIQNGVFSIHSRLCYAWPCVGIFCALLRSTSVSKK